VIFGAFFVNGLISIAFCWLYRQPLVFFWTIPGTVLVGPALGHLSYAEVIGAFIATGILMLALGLSGWVRRAMEAVPMPIVMGMVAGVFLRFGLDLVFAIRDDFWIAAPMVAAFVAISASQRLTRLVPPLIGALVVGAITILVIGRFEAVPQSVALVQPNFYAPAFSWRAMVELVVPLAITVLVVQNGQGITVLRGAGHMPPVNAVTIACAQEPSSTAFVGAVSTCLTGPVNAIISSSGERRRHYTAGIFVGLLALAFGLFAPFFTAPHARRAQSLHRRARGPCDAARAADRVHGELQGPLRARRAGDFSRDRRDIRSSISGRRSGPRLRLRRLAPARAQRLPGARR